MTDRMSHFFFTEIMRANVPAAIAEISGGDQYPWIKGVVQFYNTPYGGLIVEIEVANLPKKEDKAASFFGFHIHENGDCSNNFANTGNHYNPTNAEHPEHRGDMPPLFSVNGYAWMSFYDANLTVQDIMDRSVIIHDGPDDFTTQPSGNSGDKIACGVIRA